MAAYTIGQDLGGGERITGQMMLNGQPIWVTNRGGVHTSTPDQFYGAYGNLPAEARNNPDREFTGIETSPLDPKGYRIKGNDGTFYDFYSDGGMLPLDQRRPGMAKGYQSTPEYLAFLRQLGVEETNARAEAGVATDKLDRQLTGVLPALAEQGAQSRRGLAGSLEDRGIYRSGETERRMAEQRAQEAGQVSAAQSAAAEGKAGVQAQLARALAEQQRRQAETELSLQRQETLNQSQIQAQAEQAAADRATQLEIIRQQNEAQLEAIRIANQPALDYYQQVAGTGGVVAAQQPTLSAPAAAVPVAPAAPAPQVAVAPRQPAAQRTTTTPSTRPRTVAPPRRTNVSAY